MKFNSILLFFLVLTLLGCKGNKSLTSDQKPLSPDEAEITEREEIRFVFTKENLWSGRSHGGKAEKGKMEGGKRGRTGK